MHRFYSAFTGRDYPKTRPPAPTRSTTTPEHHEHKKTPPPPPPRTTSLKKHPEHHVNPAEDNTKKQEYRARFNKDVAQMHADKAKKTELFQKDFEGWYHFNYHAWNFKLDFIILSTSAVVCLLLLLMPWFITTEAHNYYGCEVPRGMIFNPFMSGLCDIDSMTQVGHWQKLRRMVGAIFGISASMYVISLYYMWHEETMSSGDKLYFNYACILISTGLFGVTVALQSKFKNEYKPPSESLYGTTAIWIVIVLVVIRILVLLYVSNSVREEMGKEGWCQKICGLLSPRHQYTAVKHEPLSKVDAFKLSTRSFV